MLRSVLLAALLLAIPMTFAGCASDNGGREHLENEDLPESFHRARELENQAFEQVEKGNRRRHAGKRRQHFDSAIALLRQARDLYENELIENKGTVERRNTMEREMDRLSDEIAKLHKARPTER